MFTRDKVGSTSRRPVVSRSRVSRENGARYTHTPLQIFCEVCCVSDRV